MRTALLTLLLLITACGDDRPPAPTAAESDRLNQAEDLLNQEAANEKGPEQRGNPSK